MPLFPKTSMLVLLQWSSSLHRCQGHVDSLCVCSRMFFLKPWRNEPLSHLMLFVLTYKTVLKTMLLWSNSLSYLRGLSPGYNPQFSSELFSISSYSEGHFTFICKKPIKTSNYFASGYLGFPDSSIGKESTCNAPDLVWEDPLEKEKATHSSILAWGIP